jgi:hypothetical protein
MLRSYVRWFSVTLAAVGWLATLWLGLHHGESAGVNTWFIAALSIGITATIVAGQWWLIPTRAEIEASQAVYGIGYQDGLSCGSCPLRSRPQGSEPTRPTLVR